MSAVSDITLKIKADSSDALDKIRALQREAQTPPVEVLLVAPKTGLGTSILSGVLLNFLFGLSAGFALMLLLPLATRTFGVPLLGPGYWSCVGLIVLTRVVVHTLFLPVKPTASVKRPS